ncbi:MAG: DUF4382 domain-containing protein [Christiangramia sp.]
MRILKTLNVKTLLLAAMVVVGLISCDKDDDGSVNGGGTANLTVRMTDAPGDYDAVLIDVQDIMIHVDAEGDAELEGDDDGDGWISVENVNTGVYDLLELTGGVSELLADTEVPAGFVSQIRLVLGTNNSIVVDGESKPLNTPSAQQSGLKLQLNQDFEPGESYAYMLDFDVDQSVVTTGNGGYNLKPVIRVAAEINSGTVVGSVSPANIQSLVKISNTNNTISAYTDAEGHFSLNGVPPGTYMLTITPDVASGLSVYTIETIEVEANETTELELIEL